MSEAAAIGARPGSLTYEELTGTQKTAIVMLMFGEQGASQVLQCLSPQEVQQVGAAMYTVRGLDHTTIEQVLDEFLDNLNEQTTVGVGTNAYVRGVLNSAFGRDRAQSVLGRISRGTGERPIEILDWMDANAVVELIYDEHPQVIALVIASLNYQHAAEVLSLLPDTSQHDIVHRIATLNTIQPDALQELERVIQQKFKANSSLSASSIGGVQAAARIMNFTKQDTEQRIMREIRKDDKDLQQALQDNMFVFDNLGKSGDRALQTLLREVEQDLLVMALKGTDAALREKLLGCLSTRAAANIRDDMEAMGPVKLSDVREAQKQVVAIARRLSDEGTIVLAGRGGEEIV